MKKIKIDWLLVALLLLLQCTLLIYFGSTKQGMHFDEVYSYFTTNASGGRTANDGAWLDGEDIRKDFYVIPGEAFHYREVIREQSYDVHPPVFYLMLHTVCSLMPGVFSMWQGVGLNIVYTLITTIFTFLILKKLTGKTWIAFFLSLLYICNPGVITNVMLIRMYMLMTMWMMLAIWLHLCMRERMYRSYYAINAALAFVGFLTHYYYLIFLFFLEACYWLPRLKKEWKRFLIYAGSMLGAGILAVLCYPASLGHIFVGYRGKQATGNFFHLSDLLTRFRFFGSLLDQFVFQGAMLPIFLFAFAALTVLMIKARARLGAFVQCMLLPTLGFFLVSVKASLYGEMAMLRYQLPVYGLILLCVGVIFVFFAEEFLQPYSHRYSVTFLMLCFLVQLGLNSKGILEKNVYFCYPEQKEMVEFAKEHASDTVVYLYHKDEYKYLMWADSLQLWNYDRIYFVNADHADAIVDDEINQAKYLVVYVSVMGADKEPETYLDTLCQRAPGVEQHSLAYESTYAKVYELE